MLVVCLGLCGSKSTAPFHGLQPLAASAPVEFLVEGVVANMNFPNSYPSSRRPLPSASLVCPRSRGSPCRVHSELLEATHPTCRLLASESATDTGDSRRTAPARQSCN